jgi:tetratricopeptide (TPR) repeat protein
MSGRMRNVIVYLLVLAAIVGISVSFSIGKEQEKGYQRDYERYQTVIGNMQEGNWEEADREMKPLLHAYANSSFLQWQYAVILAQQLKYEEATIYFLKAQKQRPFLVRDQRYLMQFAEVLYYQGNYAKAKKYFEEAKRINTAPQLSAAVDQILNDINHKLEKK